MEISLKKDELIILYLKEYIPIKDICNYIIKLKNILEKKDTLDYHTNRWNTICKEHIYTRLTQCNKFSYIFNLNKYVIKADHRINFYQMTGISYQVLELIYELIRIKNEKSWDMEIDDKDEWLIHDDNLYSKLSKMIMNEMRNTY
jgi:hypothetical protein